MSELTFYLTLLDIFYGDVRMAPEVYYSSRLPGSFLVFNLGRAPYFWCSHPLNLNAHLQVICIDENFYLYVHGIYEVKFLSREVAIPSLSYPFISGSPNFLLVILHIVFILGFVCYR